MNGVNLGAIIVTDGTTGATFADILGGADTPPIQFLTQVQHLAGAGRHATPTPFAEVSVDDGVRSFSGGVCLLCFGHQSKSLGGRDIPS